jgi:hypothetical protein
MLAALSDWLRAGGFRFVVSGYGRTRPAISPTDACIRVIDLSANLLPGNYVYSVAEVSLTATIRLTQHA